jgi:sugar O-acyltransferase (sialic acid O-acetyltransferase NeuD family)
VDRTSLILVGGGEHARVVAESVMSLPQFELLGFVDPEGCPETVRRLGLRWLGGEEVLAEYSGALGVLGVGATRPDGRRRNIVARLEARLRGWATVIDPAASVSATATIAPGVVVLPGVVINSGARVGLHAVINTAAVIEHDVDVGDFAFIGSGAVLGGGAAVEADAFVGLGARLRDHRKIGKGAMVGMGAVIVKDVSPGVTVVGVPARPLDGKP